MYRVAVWHWHKYCQVKLASEATVVTRSLATLKLISTVTMAYSFGESNSKPHTLLYPACVCYFLWCLFYAEQEVPGKCGILPNHQRIICKIFKSSHIAPSRTTPHMLNLTSFILELTRKLPILANQPHLLQFESSTWIFTLHLMVALVLALASQWRYNWGGQSTLTNCTLGILELWL